MIDFGRIRAIIAKEFIQLRRSPYLRAILVAQPVIMILIFGFGIRQEIVNSRWAVLDMDRSENSRRLVAEFQTVGITRAPEMMLSESQMDELFTGNLIKAGLIIPPGFNEKILRGEKAEVQLILNGADPMTAGRIQGYFRQIAMRFMPEPELTLPTRDVRPLLVAGIEIRDRAWYNPGGTDPLFYIPALPGMMLMMAGFILGGAALVSEKERGTFEHLLSTPAGSLEIVLAKLFTYIPVGIMSFTIVVGLGWLVFGVGVRGDFLFLALASLVFYLTCLALGLLVSSYATASHQSTYVTMFLILPNIILSGMLVSINSLPPILQKLNQLLPLTHYVKLIRSVTLRGGGFQENWIPFTILLVMCVVFTAVAVRAVPKRLA